MSRGAVQNAIDDVCEALTEAFGEKLLSVYLYGSLADGTYQQDMSDINILVILEDEVDLHRFRQALRPVWLRHSWLLRHSPVVANPLLLSRHLFLNPLLAEHLTTHAQLLAGVESLPDGIRLSPIEKEARYTKMALQASACLAPMLLSEKEINEINRNLNSLVRQLNGPLLEKEMSSPEIFAWASERIQSEIDSQAVEQWSNSESIEPPPLIDSLVAIYEFETRLLLVMSVSATLSLSEQILSVNWSEVADRVGEEYRHIEVITPTQLRLMLTYETPADYYLKNLIHAWGSDPIANLGPEKWRIYRDLGRLPSNIQLVDLPHAYITTSDSDIAMLVHDLQNKLLNIRLRNELLCRLEGTELNLPPKSLPDRQTDHQVGIDAIYSHLEWWADYYFADMQTALAN